MCFIRGVGGPGTRARLYCICISEIIKHFAPTQQICFERLKKRDRPEESTVTQTYLESIHRRHEEWLVEKSVKYVHDIVCLRPLTS